MRKVPGVEGAIEKEKAKALKSIRESFETPGQKFDRIPEKGKEYSVCCNYKAAEDRRGVVDIVYVYLLLFQEVLALMTEAQQYDLSKYPTAPIVSIIFFDVILIWLTTFVWMHILRRRRAYQVH